MKKLLLITSLCVTTFTYTFTKNDLENAVRSLDVSAVQQILANEKLTLREYTRYLNLAEEMVRNREVWLLKYYRRNNDVTTPYEEPNLNRIVFDILGGLFFLSLPGALIEVPEKPNALKTSIVAASFLISAAFFGKTIKDVLQVDKSLDEHKKLIRKKYDYAVTIKQLIYTSNIIEA